MPSSQSFSRIHRRISDSPDPAPPVNRGEPLKTIASRDPPSSAGSHLRDHVLQEQERAVGDARQASPEPARVAEFRFGFDLLLDLLPLHAERRVGQQVVESAAGIAILAERIAEDDAPGPAAQQHLRLARRPRFGVELLAEEKDPCVRIDGFDRVLGGRQHAAGAAGRVEDADDLAFAEDRVHVRGDQQVHHQVDDLARREVVAGLAVGVLVEPADQVLEDVAHVVGGQFVQVVHGREPADDPVQELGLGEPGDLVVEAEAVDDPPDVRREAVDVVAQVLRHRGGVRRDRGEVQARTCCRREARSERCLSWTLSTASSRRSTVNGKIT